MLTPQDKEVFETKISNLKKRVNLFREKYKIENRNNIKDKLDEENFQGYGTLQLGFQFVISIFIFLFGGYYLDSKLTTNPLFLFLGLFIGFALGLYRLINVTNQNK